MPDSLMDRIRMAIPSGFVPFLVVCGVVMMFPIPGGLLPNALILFVSYVICTYVGRRVNEAKFLRWFTSLTNTSTVEIGDVVYEKKLGYWVLDDRAYTDEEMLRLTETSFEPVSYHLGNPNGVARLRDTPPGGER